MPDIVPEAILADELAISCWLLTACIWAAASRQPRKCDGGYCWLSTLSLLLLLLLLLVLLLLLLLLLVLLLLLLSAHKWTLQ